MASILRNEQYTKQETNMNLPKKGSCLYFLLHADFLLVLLFDPDGSGMFPFEPEDGSNMFF
jgi:hypothetical protein